MLDFSEAESFMNNNLYLLLLFEMVSRSFALSLVIEWNKKKNLYLQNIIVTCYKVDFRTNLKAPQRIKNPIRVGPTKVTKSFLVAFCRHFFYIVAHCGSPSTLPCLFLSLFHGYQRNSAWANSMKEGVVNYKSPASEIYFFKLSPSSNIKEGVEL